VNVRNRPYLMLAIGLVAVTVVLVAAPPVLDLLQRLHGNGTAAFFAADATELSQPRVEVPMTFVLGDRATVQVMLNDQGPFTFAVETGAPLVLMTDALADRLALPASSSGVSIDLPGAGSRPVLNVATLKLGGLTLRDLPACGSPEYLPGVDGLLGLSAFHGLLATIDHPGSRLVLERGELPEPDGRQVLSLLHLDSHVAVEVSIDGRRFPAVIDTQSDSDIEAATELAATLPFVAPPVVVGRVAVGGLPSVPRSAARLSGDLLLGACTIQKPILTVYSPPPDYARQLLLGAGCLRHFALTLDLAHDRVRFAAA
jgi:Aspartyl protease